MSDQLKKIICYCRWADAAHSMAESTIADLGELAVLDEVGFLVKESDESITLATESQDDALSVRFWLTIPKVNIIEMHRTTLGKLLKAAAPRKRKTISKNAPKEIIS